eukprot:984217-Pyramimonas_sp.AAC.1
MSAQQNFVAANRSRNDARRAVARAAERGGARMGADAPSSTGRPPPARNNVETILDRQGRLRPNARHR